VDEANLVFTLNIGVFDELEGSAAGTVWKFAASTFMERLMEANPVIRQWAGGTTGGTTGGTSA
jgi:hypothetical protein